MVVLWFSCGCPNGHNRVLATSKYISYLGPMCQRIIDPPSFKLIDINVHNIVNVIIISISKFWINNLPSRLNIYIPMARYPFSIHVGKESINSTFLTSDVFSDSCTKIIVFLLLCSNLSQFSYVSLYETYTSFQVPFLIFHFCSVAVAQQTLPSVIHPACITSTV